MSAPLLPQSAKRRLVQQRAIAFDAARRAQFAAQGLQSIARQRVVLSTDQQQPIAARVVGDRHAA